MRLSEPLHAIEQVSPPYSCEKLALSENGVLMMNSSVSEATLSSAGDMTVFSFGKHVIRFKTSPHLERYAEIREWDKGYIVCTAKYDNASGIEEEYIDLVPILKNLYFDPDAFLKPIQKVRIAYD